LYEHIYNIRFLFSLVVLVDQLRRGLLKLTRKLSEITLKNLRIQALLEAREKHGAMLEERLQHLESIVKAVKTKEELTEHGENPG